MANNVPELTSENVADFSKQDGFVLIDFFAEWCGPCVMMSPIIDELAEKFDGKINFGKANVDECGEFAQKFQVSSIPNFVLFKDGEKVNQFVGGMSADDFEKKLEKEL